MLPVRSHDHHAAVWAHHAEYERRLHSLLDALPKDFADDFGQFIHFLVLPGKTPEVFGLWSFLIIGVARTAALRCTFLHLRLYMLAAPTIENEYRRIALDVRDGADKLHWLAAMANRRCGSLSTMLLIYDCHCLDFHQPIWVK